MSRFRTALAAPRHLFFDGSIGVFFQSKGMPAGMSSELFGMERPDVVREVHGDYLKAGAEILTTNTFQGSRYKLPQGTDVFELNKTMASLAVSMSKELTGGTAMVAGSVGPTGVFIKPLGPASFAEVRDAFKEQIEGLVAGGVDALKLETHFDLAEIRAAVVAAREVTDLPIIANMTFEGTATLTGTPALTFVDTMQNLGVDVIGINCGAGPVQMVEIVDAMLPRLTTPLLVQPNAGLPELEDGKTVFKLGPEEFTRRMGALVERGAKLLAGCCGTRPEHIAKLKEAFGQTTHTPPLPPEPDCLVATSRMASTCFFSGFDTRYADKSAGVRPTVLIGERINPTGKKQLTEELSAGEFGTALAFAKEQEAQGAGVLDVNVGAPMVDETVLLPELITALSERTPVPLCLDSSDNRALERALEAYPATPLVNSISGEDGKMQTLGPLCKKFGAPFILLPLVGKKLPVSAADRIAILDDLLKEAEALGIPKRLILVDVLVLTVSSKAEAGRACLETIRYCTETLGLPTTMGLSNVSFGLPARTLINSNFLAMSIGAGLASCIGHPGSARIREAMTTADLLMHRDPQAERFIADYSGWKPGTPGSGGAAGAGGGGPAKKGVATTVEEAVVSGDKEHVVELVKKLLEEGEKPYAIVNERLIPAITEVGDLYEKKVYFLPQLLLSAETMKTAFAHLKPLLEAEAGAEEKPVIIIATVEGDIHDIGKNIVTLMLGNHGFDVIDLGKDVPAARIVDEAEARKAPIICLSALMTTTMVRMEDTVKLVKERGLGAKVMVGGAVVTQKFADAIGADGYSEDAVAAVRLAQRLLAEVRA